MKEKGSRKVNFPEAIILLVIVVFIMIWTTLIGQIPTAVGLVYCAALCGIYGKILGHTWDEMFKNILHVVHGALPAIFLLLLVGFISASWIGSGTIPYMIYLGLELMHPTIYLFSAFLLCAIASIVTGSSVADGRRVLCRHGNLTGYLCAELWTVRMRLHRESADRNVQRWIECQLCSIHLSRGAGCSPDGDHAWMGNQGK